MLDPASRHARALQLALERRVALAEPSDGAGLFASWERCLGVHGLHPERIARPTVLSPIEIQDHREPMADLLALSQGEVQRLHELLAEQDYVVMLNDAQGVALSFRSSAGVLDACSAAGVLPGSVWCEELQGTNGVGLCIQEQRPLSVVMQDHFAASLTNVSCTVAPIFGAAGQLAGVLDATTLRPSDRTAQAMVRHLVAAAARRIENLCFSRRHAGHALLRLSRHDDFSDTAAEARIALDATGRVVDATPLAQRLLERSGIPLIGQPLAHWQGLAGLRGGAPGTACLELENGRLYVRLELPGARPTANTALAASRAASPRVQDDGDRPSVADIVGSDARVCHDVAIARRLVGHRVPVFLHGETGTGKSALARALHLDAGGSPDKFVAINCAAITPELIESELFGYRPGAFTGASRHGARGRLLEADGGMLFLDEIGDMPLGLQTRLLQVLSDGEFVPVGATLPVRVQFALVAASLHDLEQQVRAGRFREDLYYRLAGATVRLPVLRQRADRDELVDRAFARAARQCGVQCPALQPAARQALAAYGWPGNLRELQHVARYATAIDGDASIGLDDLPPLAGVARAGASAVPTDDGGVAIRTALERSHWNVAAAAVALGISRATMHRRMRALGIGRSE
jgi:transcriptional regulator of acetoin/glycerol metabolism